MACIKEVNRSASVAIAPDSPYLAAGTMAGAVDVHFSSSANLDIFELDFTSTDRQLRLAGSVQSSEPFNRLSWGRNPVGSDEFSLGLIAGGLNDGNIGIWNPKSLICSNASGNAIVSNLSRHKGPVRGLEFNSLTPNHLASGADEGEICIWDIAKPAEPTHFPPLKGSGSATQGEISYLSWNSKVQHILASTSFNGTTVVWDLRKQKPVISFSDSIRRRCSVMQWNPDFATQLIVASDEDNSPSLRIWDMRNTMSPLKELVGHTKGVVAMSWCPVIAPICLLVPKIIALFAGTWLLQRVAIRFGIGEGDFGGAPLRAPKWYKRKAGVSFGFGGKLVSFNSGDASDLFESIVTEDSLVGRSSDFEAVINGDRSSLRLLCDKKSQESESEDDRETWGFLKVMFEDDGTARTQLLAHLGFISPTEEKDVVQDDISQEVLEENVAKKEGYPGEKETAIFPSDNGEDFFNNLPSPKAETPVSTSDNNFIGGSLRGEEEFQQEMDGPDEGADASFDASVQRALVVGDYKEAVAQCISANRMADALVIAHAGGASLWERTRDQYLKMSRSPYLKVVSAMVNNDLMSLVNTRPLNSWKQTLALLCTFAQREEWTLLCDTLASKLLVAGDTLAAVLCYICAGNIDKTVEIWSKNLTIEHDGKSYVEVLQDLMEKTMVLALATGQKRFSASLCKLVEKYAEILASQGLLTTAMQYLKLIGSEELSPELMILQDRIACSIEPENEAHKSMPFESSQSSGGASYGGDQSNYGNYEAPRSYIQETQQLPSVPTSPYVDRNPYNPSYGRGYDAPTQYQPAPQPSIFVPSPAAAQTPPMNFAQPAVPPQQPPVKPFVPTEPPALRDAVKYQPPSLGSQLYPGNAHPTYHAGPPAAGPLGPVPSQVGPATGHKMPQVVAPTQSSHGFMPITANPGMQRPGMGPMQPPSPVQSAAVQPAATPAAPPPTVQSVNTSNVPAHQKPVISTLTRLFNETSEALGGARANPARKREIEDNSKRIGALFAKLNSGDISKNAAEKLVQLCQALDNGDYPAAIQIQVSLTTSDWDECNFWLATLKRMIKTRQNLR